MQSDVFVDQLEKTKRYSTHEGKIEEMLFLNTAVLIAILQKLEQQSTRD